METMLCLNCQAENLSTARFCVNCGAPFKSASQALPDMATRRLEPELPDTTNHRLEPERSDTAIRRLDPELPDTATRRLEPELPDTSIRRLDPELPDTATRRLEPELPVEPASSVPSKQEPGSAVQDIYTVHLTPEAVVPAYEPPVEKSPQDFSTKRQVTEEVAQVLSPVPVAVPPEDMSTRRLEPVDIHDALTKKLDIADEVPYPPRHFCHICGALLKPDLKFCDNCGAILGSADSSGAVIPPMKLEPAAPIPPAPSYMAGSVKPPKRRRKIGCIMLLLLLCLLAVAAVVLGVLYQDQIIDLLGLV